MKKNIRMYFLFLLLLMLLSNLTKLDMDGIWSYGFSYNIANGMVPYRDFNMIIGPFYSLFFSVFIKIFGNYLVFFELGNAIVFSFILLLIYKKIGKYTYYFILYLFLQPALLHYNIFCSMLFILILILIDSDNKYKNIIIGLLIGIIFMTKHNIGILLFIVYFLYNKEYIKSVLSFSIPIFICLMYLLFTTSFFNYIEYCYLGMGKFLDNFVLELPVLFFSIIIYYSLIKIYLKTKDIKIIYIFAFQVLLFPIYNIDHFIPAVIPIIYYYFLMCNTNIKLLLKYTCLFITIGTFLPIILSSKLITNNTIFKYKIVDQNLNNYLIHYTNYLNGIDGKVYLFIFNDYLIKIYNNEKIDFYDLINEGNFGLNKKDLLKQLSDDCSNQKCTFILDKSYFNGNKIQLSEDFKKYVIENATYSETIPSGDRVYIKGEN